MGGNTLDRFVRARSLATWAAVVGLQVAIVAVFTNVATAADPPTAGKKMSARQKLAAAAAKNNSGTKNNASGKSNVAAKNDAPKKLPPTLATASGPRTIKNWSAVSSSGIRDEELVAFIDEQIRAGWAGSELKPSGKATDNEWCRRVYLDVLGRVPTVEEIRQFSLEAPTTKKIALLNRLLESEEYSEDYAANWTTIWTNLLIGRPPARPNRRDPTSREGMQQYLRRSFLANKPWDTMVSEMVSATGTTSPGSPDYNGATNFLIGKLQENDIEATAKTAKFFLGLQVQCTQCHNHPFNDWKQEQFWSLNAFFRQTRSAVERNGRDIQYARLKNEDFKGEGSTPRDAEIYFELRNGTLQVAYPMFIDGTRLPTSGYIKDVDRRTELARLIVKSDYLGKAIVNRMWGHFLGYGFTKPVDDFGPHNQPSHPELLERLGHEFAAQGHDLKRLIRWICLSEAYGLSSKMTADNKKDDPALGERPRFSHFYLRQMQAEQLYDSLVVITNEHKRPGTYEEKQDRKQNVLRQFTLTFGNADGEDATTFNGTIPQTLMMMNGDMIEQTISIGRDSFLRRLAAGASEHEAVDLLFLASLGRKPTQADAAMARSLLGTRRDKLDGYQDLLWALLNCNEFIFIH
ncbi:MAG: DUF1549 domain-containing protein [Planctomycetes bacterium]|nr:DUF1549 domain-containing protein [Planctomycetota bacterium]